jgi:DNA-binding GntR family transcriptional regulator
MSPGPTFDRVYHALKVQLTGGRFAPGEHLEPATIGEDLNSSITPVRDALHRLVGERIVEAPRGDGFRVPAPTEAELRNLYDWNQALLELALRPRARRPEMSPLLNAPGSQPAPAPREFETAAQLFLAIARRAGNPENAAAVDNLNDRLGAVRLVEAGLFLDFQAEFARIVTIFAGGDHPMLRRELAIYHRRRKRHTPELLIATRAEK